MLGNRRILVRFSRVGASLYTRDWVSCHMWNGFCNIIESPELPIWVKSSHGDDDPCVEESEDDFVLPTKLDGLGDWGSNARATHRHITDAGILPVDESVVDSVVDEISNILKTRFTSPEAVVQALGSCSLNMSKDVVVKTLKRFNNDWVSSFGFFKWADIQTGYKHSPDSYDTMVDILGKSKQFDSMLGLVGEMVQVGGLVSLATMSKVMRRLAGAGRWGDAIRTFHGIECYGVKKDTMALNVLLDSLCKERSVKHARDVFLEVRSVIPPNAISFNALIHGWCQARKLEEARLTMEEMRRSGFSPCVISYTCLIEECCKEKNFRKVDAILDEMQANGCPPNVVTYTIVMHSLGKAKDTQEALRIFDKMKSNGCVLDTSFYNSLIYTLGRAGRLRDAHDVFEEMSKNGYYPNVTTYNTMIAAACDHSQEEDALSLLLKMNSCKPDVKTYSPLLKMCCKRKRMKILCYLLNDMFKKDISLDLGTYTLLVQGLCKSGKVELSCLFFKEMVLKGLIPRHHTYKMLMEELERKNMDREKANILLIMEQAQDMKPSGHHSRTDIWQRRTDLFS